MQNRSILIRIKIGHCAFQIRPLASETGQYPPFRGPHYRVAKASRIRRILAANVRRLREAKGLSQGALAADAVSTKS
jgi:hypothetical protein